MNLFRSEGHARNWSGFKTGTEAGLMPLGKLMTIFSADFAKKPRILDIHRTFF